jgi:nitroreductase/NAD-dependent dihydropyrimidine dehydrogenase PreA subunit
MSVFVIDREKCRKDGICAAECVLKVIEMKEGDAFPSAVDGAENLCMNCGHCVAVCPYGAISITTMGPEECVPVEKELFPRQDQLEHFLLSRRSIRAYKGQPVPLDVLTKLIDTASHAPSGHNWQAVKWLIIEDKSEVRRLAGMVIDFCRYLQQQRPALAQTVHCDLLIESWEKGQDMICRDAPHIVAVYAPREIPTAPTDCAIALTYLELAAFSMGLGTCWNGFFYIAAAHYPPLEQALGVPEGHQVFGAMLLGYPRYRYHRIPLRNKPSITWGVDK